MKLKIEITTGLQFTATGDELSGEHVLKVVEQAEILLAGHFGGCTSFYTRGIYTHKDGRVVRERGRTFVAFTEETVESRIAILNVVRFLKTELHQESVLVSSTSCDFALL